MNKITVAEALIFAEQAFPHAPEYLAEHLGIEVRRSPLNCDGWCLQTANRSIIRINSKAAEVRQRFTLAHELGHLILGVPTIVGESMLDVQRSNSEEEKMVNAFAAKLLLPKNRAIGFIPEVPVTAAVLRKIARKARVSELFVARRLASLASDLDLKASLVVYYKNNVFDWQWSETVWMEPNFAQILLHECIKASPNPARIPREEESDVIVASRIENPYSDTTTIFLQLVPEKVGLKKLGEEAIRELEDFIFQNDNQFKMSLQGCFGTFKSRIKDLSIDDAVQLFNKTYLRDSTRWGEAIWERLASETGQQYIRLRLKAWIKD